MDRLDAMRLFCQIVDAGSLAKAAKVLGVSPTTVTQSLARLESLYGTSLLERTTRRMAVTEAGMILYERAKALLEEATATEAAVRGATSNPKGSLRVTLPLGVAVTFLYPRLNEFATQYPDISLDLQVNDQIIDLVAGNFDIGLRAGVLADAAVVAYPLLRYTRLTCVNPDYLQRHGMPLHPSDLTTHSCLTYRHDSAPIDWHYWIDSRFEAIRVSGAYASNESYALLAMARDGLGITRQPDWLVATDLKEGKLVTILDEFNTPLTPASPGIHAVVQRRHFRTAKVNAFLEFVKSVIV